MFFGWLRSASELPIGHKSQHHPFLRLVAVQMHALLPGSCPWFESRITTETAAKPVQHQAIASQNMSPCCAQMQRGSGSETEWTSQFLLNCSTGTDSFFLLTPSVEVHLASKTQSEAFSVFDMTLLVTEECPMMQQRKKWNLQPAVSKFQQMLWR